MNTLKDTLRPFGELDTLYYYARAAYALEKFLKGKEIAAKNWLSAGGFRLSSRGRSELPPRFLIKRGSYDPPLFVEEFQQVDEVFLKKRVGTALKDAKGLTETQEKIWRYFLPRKYNDFFYATNGEKTGGPLERIFFDLDRGLGGTAEQALQAACAIIACAADDSKTKLWTRFATWTGKSFHVFLFPPKPLAPSEYTLFKYENEKSLTRQWFDKIKLPFLSLGHEKTKGIVIDPSQTPSGKLCRAPFSLHMKDWKTADGVCLPLKESMLEERNIVKHLQSQTLEGILDDFKTWSQNLPRRFQ